MVIDLKTYRENKEVIKSFEALNRFFNDNFPDKSWGWVGVTALLYSQLALENHLGTEMVNPQLKPALKSILWQYMNVVTRMEKGKEHRHE